MPEQIAFLTDLQRRPLAAADVAPFEPKGLWIGNGNAALEVALVAAERAPAVGTPGREERELRRLFDDLEGAGATTSGRLIAFVLGTGIEPFRAPPPLPPIEVEEIHLVCWMAVEPEATTLEGKLRC